MLKIAYIGNFEPTHSTENHVRLSLESLGIQVIKIQENKTTPGRIEAVVKEHAPDAVFYTRTWGLHGPSMLDLWKKFKQEDIPTVSYHLDLYRTLARHGLYKNLSKLEITGLHNDPFWQTEFCCTVDGDPESAKWFKENGVNHYWVRAGVYHRECYQVPGPIRYPVLFVGSYGYHPEWPYRPHLIDWLQNNYGDQFTRIGPPNNTVRNHELNVAYGQSMVCVGDTLCPNFTHAGYWSDRVYETLGRGGFIIHPYIKGMELEFTDGEHLVFYEYNNFGMLKELIDHYLTHHDEREKIRNAGHALVKEHCTYQRRMREILEIVLG